MQCNNLIDHHAKSLPYRRLKHSDLKEDVTESFDQRWDPVSTSYATKHPMIQPFDLVNMIGVCVCNVIYCIYIDRDYRFY